MYGIVYEIAFVYNYIYDDYANLINIVIFSKLFNHIIWEHLGFYNFVFSWNDVLRTWEIRNSGRLKFRNFGILKFQDFKLRKFENYETLKI